MARTITITALSTLLAVAPALAGDAEKGRVFLEDKCGGCHAVGASGDGPLAAAPPFRVLGERYPPETLEEALAEGIVTGHADMPEVVAPPETIDDIIAWLAKIQTAKP